MKPNKSRLLYGLCLLLLGGCAIFDGGNHESTVTGQAYDIRAGHPVVGQKLNIIDYRSFPSPFGIPRPPTIGTTTTGADGKFRVTVPGKFKNKDISVNFADASNIVMEGDTGPTAGWRIVDVVVTLRPKQ